MLTLATKFKPVAPAFETAAKAGYRAAEFWLDGSLLAESEQLAALAGQYPFRFALHFPNQGPITDGMLQGAIKLYRQLETTAMIIHQPMFNRYSKRLLELDPHLDLAIENHVLDLNGFERWGEQSPGLTLDVEHLWKFTLRNAPLATLLEHVDRCLERHVRKLQHVHLPGYLPGGEEHRPTHHSPEMAAEILNRLTECGFTKLVVSEADAEFQIAEELQSDVQFFEKWRSSLNT